MSEWNEKESLENAEDWHQKDIESLEAERDRLLDDKRTDARTLDLCKAEIDRLKAELQVRSNDPLIDGHMDYLQQQTDLWKSKAERLAEVLRRISDDQEFTHDVKGKFMRTTWYVHFAKEALAEFDK